MTVTLCFRPRNREIKRFPGPRIHCTSHRSEQIPGPSESHLRACQPAKVPVKVEFVSFPAPGLKSPVCQSHLLLRWCRSRVAGKLVMHHRTHSAWTTLSALRS